MAGVVEMVSLWIQASLAALCFSRLSIWRRDGYSTYVAGSLRGGRYYNNDDTVQYVEIILDMELLYCTVATAMFPQGSFMAHFTVLEAT